MIISHVDLLEKIKPIARDYGVNEKFLICIFIRESLYKKENDLYYLNSHAIGDNGKSWGLGQIHRNTRKILNKENVDNIDYWFNIENAIKESCRIIRDITNHIKSKNKDVTIERIASGYNAGLRNFDNPPLITKKHYIPYVKKIYNELYGKKKVKFYVVIAAIVLLIKKNLK